MAVNTSTFNINASPAANAVNNLTNTVNQYNQTIKNTYNLQNQLNSQARATIQGINDITRSFGLLQRVLLVAQIHRAINLITQSTKEAVIEAQKLSVRIGEIQTIQGKANISTREWANSLRSLSDEFGIPILQAAEGAYQAISNQVVDAANATQFLRKETKLAIATVATLDQAVSATSTVINAFKFNISETDTINAKLFKGVELGRFRLQDLGSQFGRTAILASQLGVSFDEQLASLTLLTRKGLDADVSMTLLTNVFNSLLKPSKELTQFLNSIGVNSGQAAIQTFGFSNLLGKLAAEADKSSASLGDIAKQFDDLRALTGAAALTGFFNEFSSDLQKIQGATGDFNKAIDTSLKTLGQRANVQLQQLKNAFINNLGTPLLTVIVDLVDGLGGASKAFEKLSTVVRVALIAGAAYLVQTLRTTVVTRALDALIASGAVTFGTLGVQINTAKLALVSFNAVSTLGITALVTILTEAYIRTSRFGQSLQELASKARQVEDELSERRMKGVIDGVNRSFNSLTDQVHQSSQAINIFIANTQKQNNEIVASYETAFKKIGANVKKVFGEIVSETEKALTKEERRIDKLNDAVEKAKKKIVDIKLEDAKAEDEAALNGVDDPIRRFAILEAQKTRIHREAIAARKKDEEDLADDLFKRVLEINKEQIKLVEKERQEALKGTAEKVTTTVRRTDAFGNPAFTSRRLGSVTFGDGIPGDPRLRVGLRGVAPAFGKETSTVRVPDTATAEAGLRQLNALEAERKRLVGERVALEDASIKAKAKDASVAEVGLKKQREALEQLKELLPGLDAGNLKPAEFSAGLNKAQGLAASAGLPAEAQLSLFRDLKKQEVLIHKKAEAEKLAETIEANRKAVEVTQKAIDEANARKKEAVINSEQNTGQALSGANVLIKQLEEFKKNITLLDNGARNKDFEGFISKLSFAKNALHQALTSGTDTKEPLANLKKVEDEFALFVAQLSKNTTFHGDKFGTLFADFKSTRDAQGRFKLGPGGEALAPQLRALSDLTAKSIESQAAIVAANTKLAQLQPALAALNREAAKVPRVEIEAAEAAEAWAERSNASSIIINKGLDGTITRLKEIRALQGGLGVGPAGVPGKAFGGRGIDSQLAMLAPGEMVLTQSVSRAFGPYFHALNNATVGNSSKGGSVTFGDINISTAAGTTDEQTMQIAGRLQRLARRGLFSI